ncbi:MAG: VOC family protein [Candidatus Promineifilaceae bacterium]|nr:VOC family protein [Candidatus Promineifilaceae bacterium]
MARQLITPHLWYDKEAQEAAEFYVAAFAGDSRINHIETIHDTPSGSVDIVSFTLLGYDFEALSAGPTFTINPSISFHVRCRTKEEVDLIWNKISPGGTALMELGEYPFSKRFGWIQDRFGVSWQVIYTEEDVAQRIMPALLFTQEVCGKAEEAINFYASIFPNASAQVLDRYQQGEEPDQEGTVRYAQLVLDGQEFGAMDSALAHDFTFNEAVSLIVNCKDQAEIDYYWDKLSAVPAAEQCGWIKDKFGVSWQIIPENMGELMAANPEKTTPVMLQMKKINIDELVLAGAG